MSDHTGNSAHERWKRVGGMVRWAGVLFVFLPLAMLSAGLAFGVGFSSPGARGAGSLGWGLNSQDVAGLFAGFAWVCAGLGLVLLAGRPRWPGAVGRFFAGFGALLAATIVAAETEDVGLVVLLLGLAGMGLLLHALLWDRPPRVALGDDPRPGGGDP